MDNLEQLLSLNGGDGQIFTMEGPLCLKSVQAMFGYVCLRISVYACMSVCGRVVASLRPKGTTLMFQVPVCVSRRLIDQAYSPFHAVLRCGNLSSDVQVFPRPEPVVMDDEVDPMPRRVQTGIDLAIQHSA